MDNKTRLEEIKSKLVRLRTLDPLGKALFGADYHLYRLNPPVLEAKLVAFEALHQITLPLDYRDFLLQVGNGGAGPWYGLWELDVTGFLPNSANIEERSPSERVTLSSFSSSFQHSSLCWKSENLNTLEESDYADFKEIALDIGTQGCNISNLLVVTGVNRGEIWSVWKEEFLGFSYISPKKTKTLGSDYQPFETNGEGALPFLDWYEHWLDIGLNIAIAEDDLRHYRN